ncbi:hypothetical protein HDU98_003128, partial [Podochytrium sp. JEL0797]
MNFTIEEAARHNKESDLWVVIHGKVYDITDFVSQHPGGKKVLLKVAGTDASKQFDQFHSAGVLEKLGPALLKGTIAQSNTTNSPSNASIESQALVGTEPGESFGDLVPFGDPYWYQDWSSPYYNESHRKLRSFVRNFCEKEIIPFCFE